MKSRCGLFINLGGILLPFLYLYYEYLKYRDDFIEHLKDLSHFSLFHLIILLFPILAFIVSRIINQREELIKRLRDKENELRDIFDNAPDGYQITKGDMRIMDVNKEWLRILGYNREDVIGRYFYEFIPQESRDIYFEKLNNLKREGIVEDCELELLKKNGVRVPSVLNARAMFDDKGDILYVRCILRDVTKSKELEKRIERASKEWRSTFDAIPNGVMLLDSEFRIMRLNKYMESITGMAIRDMIGKKCYEIMHMKDIPLKDCPLKASLMSSKSESIEYYHEGLKRYFKIQCVPQRFDGDIYYIHTMSDITELKEKEIKLTEAKDALFNMLDDLNEAYNELRTIHKQLIYAFANAIDAKSSWTKGHSERVAYYAEKIGHAIGLDEDDIEKLIIASLLHDIGKIGTYDTILEKPDKLTDEEFQLIKMHPLKGVEILGPIDGFSDILPIIRHHHERWDGKGYPDGLKGEEIPLLSRIISVVDSFDSMTSERPYRPSPGIQYAISEFKRCAGAQFDPEIVEVFLKVIEELGLK